MSYGINIYRTKNNVIDTKTTKQKALEELKVRDSIIIPNAAKGGAVVMLDVKDYVKECERQLNNTEN